MKKFSMFIICIYFYANSFSQPWTPKEKFGDGEYKEYDHISNLDYPYTTFFKGVSQTVDQQLQNIRDLIIAGKPDSAFGLPRNEFYIIYKQLWDFAAEAEPDAGGYKNTSISKLPSWAKAHGFIYMLNMDPDGNTLDPSDRIAIGWAGSKALQDMNTEIQWWNKENLKFRSRELICAIQAYDFLRAGEKMILGYNTNDRNHKDITPRDNLRIFARNIYNEANRNSGILINDYG